MQKGLVVVCLISLLSPVLAVACDIENKREIHVGASTGVAGNCPNNGNSIQCIHQGEGANSLTCNGPLGNFTGSDLQDLVSTACGCTAEQNNGAAGQLGEELGDVPPS